MRYYIFLLAMLWSTMGFSQNPCFCQVQLVPQSDCCVNIVAAWSSSCTAGQAQANHVFINTAFAPPFTAEVKSFDLYYPQLSATLSAGNTQLDINSTVNIATLQPLGQDIVLGSICYENVNSTVVTNEINMDNNGISSCMGASEVPVSCVPSQPWNKIYGDSNDNTPTKVKAFGDGVYVVGTISLSGVNYGTLSKFDITDGSLLWHFQHDVPSVFFDVEYSPLVQEVIVVGATEPNPPTGAPFDNKSLIMRRRASDGSMPLGGLKEYDHPGREGFLVIKRHPYPEDPNFPFYVLGAENPASNAPSGSDQVIAYNFNRNLAENWDKRYIETGGVEIEGYRGIVPLRDGDLLLIGNGSIANEGAIIKVDGRKGDWLNSWYHPDGIDWYDGVHLPNGMVVLSGTKFSSDEAIVMAVNPNNMTPLTGLLFPNQSNFREIGWHSPSSGAGTTDLYLLSREKNNGPNRNILNKVSLSIFPATGAFMNVDYSRYLEDQELSFNNPRLQVVPARDAIFYADNRTYNPIVYGGEEMLVGVYDLNLNSDCVQSLNSPAQVYSVSPTNFGMSDADININPIDQGTQSPPLGYECTNFCGNCTADFTWTSDCCELQLMGSATGTGPYTFEWDFLCDGSVDATGQSATLSNLPVGPNILCLKITDATGCMATVQQTVTVVGDNTPPVINCPNDITLTTDPGECFATFSIPEPTATDDCADNLTISCFLTGATTTPIAPVNALPKGVTMVNCTAEDEKGNVSTCTYAITVVDQEPPVVTCPSAITTSVAACAGGISVQFPDPMVSDNCPMVSWTYSHQSGDFFPCGTTTVTATATDMAGNQSTCSFPVTVDCECAEVGGETISCTDVDDQFAFSVNVIDLTGSGSNGCTVSVSSPQSGITISGVTTTGSGPGYTISGLIDVAAPPMPNTITIVVSVSCVCPDGTVHDCDFPITLQTPCCKDISVDPQEVCENGPSVQIPLVGCGNLYDVQQVRWYVADAPCPPASWGPPLQVTNGCAPLTLSPQFHNGDICVYAEVDMGPDAGPCTMLTSNIATINLCPPISCDLSGGQAYCYTGSPITPSPLSLSLNPAMPDCSHTIEWFDPNGNLIPSATGMTSYQPPALDFTLPNTECSQSYTYTVKVTSVCGAQSCSATFRLDNDDAPVGTINLLPPDVNPLCYGEDAVLEYIPECAGDPERWDWFIRPDAVPTYTPLPSNGDRNPLYYTNRLYEDTWVKVEKTNGSCSADEIEFFLDIIDPLTINSFTADYSPICAPASVDLEVDFDPSPAPAGCTYTIFWYQGVNLIHTSTHTSATAMYTYTPPAGVGLGGNYYCIIESSCCPQREKSDVIVLDPPMEVFVTGPCYRCNCETVTLDGNVLYPISGFNCTYQWYDNGVPLPGETGTSLTVDPQWMGPFTFEVTCTDGITTCIQTDIYMLMQCGSCPTICEDNIVQNGDFETGMATAGDEDITNAAFWGGIWSNAGTTFSSADLYSNTTGVPGSLQAPTPASQGQFAGFWSRIQGGDEFREGVLNELNTTILPSSGVYELSFKVACLFTPSTPASLSVYVANGGINGGTAITSGTSPTNDNLFADSWEAVVHPITTSCNNGFQTYTYTIDSSDPDFPSSGVNSIFFTRTDGVQPGAYVALDDVCLRSVCCASQQAFDDALNAFELVQNGNESMVVVNNTALNGCFQVTIDWGDGLTDVLWPDLGLSANHTYSVSGDYEVQISLEEYDSEGDICYDGVFNGGTITGSELIDTDEGLTLFPNPTSEEVQLLWKHEASFDRLLLRNVNGARLRTQLIPKTGTQATVDLSELPNGVYILQLFTADGKQVSRKVVKQ